MKILLTGASGFIGSQVLEHIVSRFGTDSVAALSSRNIMNVDSIVYKSVGEFGLRKSYFDSFTHLIHAGAFTPKEQSEANDISQCFGNVEFTKELLSYNYKKLERVINLSTLDVYASAVNKISEKTETKPVSLYGASKLYCEEMVKVFAKQRGLEFLNLRIGHVYGPGEEKYKKLLPNAIKNILQRQPLEIWGDGSELRSFIFIQDVVQAIINSLSTSFKNEDINVVSGVAISIKELLQTIVKISGREVIINMVESKHTKRDLVFDNAFLLATVLKTETALIDGLEIEYQYMKDKHEYCIRS